MKVAIVSDLHAFNSATYTKDGVPSHFDIAPSRNESQCPIKSLIAFINHNDLVSDYVLCPGDLANHACNTSLPVAWAGIENIGKALRARHVIGTVGNHDIDSRHIHNKYDPIEELKKLEPQFPVDARDLVNQFWSEHFFIHTAGGIRILVVNSSAYHATHDELEHGRVAARTIRLIESALKTTAGPLINILLCHHNPHKHSELDLGEDDEIKGGQQLLDLLGNSHEGNWLVIHGHKHHPKITYASGGASSAVVFSAGSVASTLYPKLIRETGNQFYIIELDEKAIERRGLVGEFDSWDWHAGFGWQIATASKGLPGRGGFGHRENPRIHADRIKLALSGLNVPHVKGDGVFQAFPELRYVTPLDLQALERELMSQSVLCEFSDEGQIAEICIV